MKKFFALMLALCLSAMMLVGCGCMNTNADVPTLPTNGETTKPTTAPSTAPSTEATTMPTTGSTEDTGSTGDTGTVPESTGAMEGALDDIMGGSTDDASGSNGGNGASGSNGTNGSNGSNRSRGSITPRG